MAHHVYLSRFSFERKNAAELNTLLTRISPPDGLKVLGNYTIIDKAQGFTIFECDDHRKIVKYTQQFRELIPEFEIVPIEPVTEPYHRT